MQGAQLSGPDLFGSVVQGLSGGEGVGRLRDLFVVLGQPELFAESGRAQVEPEGVRLGGQPVQSSAFGLVVRSLPRLGGPGVGRGCSRSGRSGRSRPRCCPAGAS